MSDRSIQAALVRMGLAREGDGPPLVPLAGGVSSDIYRVALAEETICVKRARARLRVAAEWRAPVERNTYEVAWIRFAARVVPDAVPEIVGEDATAGLFAMRYLPPDSHPVWKERLLAGEVASDFAHAVGSVIGRVHAASAGDAAVARRFATDALFEALRIEPYLRATAHAHPDCRAALEHLASRTLSTRRALVHGDVSPKNLLCGPKGPVLLDAECAWYGDPAFDLSFVLNHLLLKRVARPVIAGALDDAFDALAASYRRHVDWEPAQDVEARAARLLPALALARVDGKSPVEYLKDECDRERIRRASRALVLEPSDSLNEVRERWSRAVLA